MHSPSSIQSLWLTLLLGGGALSRVLSPRQVPNPEPEYTIDDPYTEPARDNGLANKHPNIIMFMPDQLRFDAVGTFGNDVSMVQINSNSNPHEKQLSTPAF